MNFSDLKLHPAVARALAARGYETATAVQAAVLDAGCVGRDLLVSSQTGSGKTVAFGAALVQTLLGDGAPADPGAPGEAAVPAAGAAKPGPARGSSGAHPLALVVVPTRELAVQVRDELGWLLKQTGLKMASFTGGTAVSGDLRALQKGVDLVIGTPGRLCDLLRRQRLELASIRVVILDEADEMLDLGFREDLQTLLQAAPDTRRTLMLSATLPPEIRSLARRFQRDALPIDPRKEAGATVPGAHDDITYVAHLIASADRLAVVVNVLRSAGTGRAIVFCTTREGVSRLHEALVARGFAATAISGDRAQAERDRALDLLRRGDARVLVATNVAARGLHLPDVDLIVHADLPLNSDSLTHRSGRTGRAGRKGTAVVIASVSERRKAERLMMSAHVPVLWTPPPSAETITAAARDRLAEELLRDETDADNAALRTPPAVENLAARLEARLSASQLLRRLLARELARLPAGERVQSVALPPAGSARIGRFDDHDEPSGRHRGRDEFNRDGVLFRVNIGAREKADPRWLLPLICRRGGVTRREVGAIRVGPTDTMFEIAGAAARDFALSASEPDPRAPHVTIARAQSPGRGAPSASSAPSAPRDATPSKPWQRSTARTATPKMARTPGPPLATLAPAKKMAPSPAPSAQATPSHAPVPQEAAHPYAPPAQVTRTQVPQPQPVRPHAPATQAARPHPTPAPSTRPRPVATHAAAPAPAPSWSMPSVQSPKRSPDETLHQGKSQVSDAIASQSVAAGARGERPGRSKAQVPVIEMKHAHRQSGLRRGDRDETPSVAAPPRAPSPEHFRARNEKHPRVRQPDRPSAVGPRHTRDENHGRATQPNRPRMDGTNPAKRTSPPPPVFSPAVPPRAPFWKDGARRRAVAPARGTDSPAKTHKGR